MIKFSSLLFLLLLANAVCAQYDSNQTKWIDDVDFALNYPDRVYNLDLSGKGLEAIPEYISDFINLEAIKLSDNRIKELSSVFHKNRNLEFIELSGNEIESLDFSVFRHISGSLMELWLRDNNIKTIDSTINELDHLEVLSLGGNAIDTIHENVDIRALKILSLDGNQLQSFPRSVNRNHKLRELNVNGNLITSLVLNSEYRNLKTLNVGDNPINDFRIDHAKYKLETLIVDWIPMKQEWLQQLPNSIRVLSMEHCDLHTLSGIAHLNRLKELSVMHNQISQEHLEKNERLKRIKKLWVQGNK